MRRRPIRSVLALAALALLPGCGKETPAAGAGAPRPVRLILDYLPNAVHAGIYQAAAAGYYRDQGLALQIETPTTTSDTLRLMAAGQAEVGIASLLDFLAVRAKREPLKIVMALEQRPLAAVFSLKKSGIVRPRDLVGRLVSQTGNLSDEAEVKWLVGHDGADPASVRLINVGFNSAQELVAGNIDAAFGFWNQDAVQVALRQPINVMRLYDFGLPPYPELVVFVREDFLAANPEVVRRFLAATSQGYADAIARPEAALAAMTSQVEGETIDGLRPYLEAIRPVFQADAPVYGFVNLAVLGDYQKWTRETGVLDFPADPDSYATNAYLPPAAAAPAAKP